MSLRPKEGRFDVERGNWGKCIIEVFSFDFVRVEFKSHIYILIINGSNIYIYVLKRCELFCKLLLGLKTK